MRKPAISVASTELENLEDMGESRTPGLTPVSSPPLSSANRWTRICRVDEIPRLGARVVRRGVAPNVAIFRTASDRFFALADRCPHRGGPLSQGIVYGERVACPLHNTNVELESGCAVAPDKGRVRSFAVKVDAELVYVDLTTQSDANS